MNSEVITTWADLIILSLPTLIFMAAVLLIVIVLELLLRPLRLWYWKVDRHGEKLDHINAQLYLLRREMGQSQEPLEMPVAAPETEGLKEKNAGHTKPAEKPEEREDAAEDFEAAELAAGLDLYPYNRDRCGRVYTEEEIERQIRD